MQKGSKTFDVNKFCLWCLHKMQASKQKHFVHKRQTRWQVNLLMAMLHSLIARRRFGPQTQWRPLRKTLTSGLGLDDMSLAWPPRGSTIGFHLLWHTVELAMSTRLCLLCWLIWFLCFRIDWVGSLYANRFFMYLCIKSSIGTQGEVS